MTVSEDQINEALDLNKRLARQFGRNRVDDLISAGHEAIAYVLTLNRAPEDFLRLCRNYISREHRLALTDSIQPVYVPRGAERPKEGALPLDFPAQESKTSGSEELLEQLPAADRLLLEQFYFEKKSAVDLAAELGVDRRTIYNRLKAITQELRAGTVKPKSREERIRCAYLAGEQWESILKRFKVGGRKVTSLLNPLLRQYHKKAQRRDWSPLVADYLSGLSIAALRKKYGVSLPTIYRYVTPDVQAERKAQKSEKIVKLFRQGKTFEDIGVSAKTIYKHTSPADSTARRKTLLNRKRASLVARFVKGAPLDELSKQYGYSEGWIMQMMSPAQKLTRRKARDDLRRRHSRSAQRKSGACL